VIVAETKASLRVRDLCAWYGSAQILFGLDFDLPPSTVVAMVGRNGVGKTTTLRSIMGLVPEVTGSIQLASADGDVELVGRSTVSVARQGIGYVPGDRRIFPDMTVLENLELGTHLAHGDRPAVQVAEMLETFPLLKPLLRRMGGVLSGGEQQLLTIARTMMGRPHILLLDEPSEGLAPVIVSELRVALEQMRAAFDVSILLVEQNLKFTLALASMFVVIENGRIVFSGSRDELTVNHELVKKYLSV
jgi:branched-chain amino acid transport system ATP-binding protein